MTVILLSPFKEWSSALQKLLVFRVLLVFPNPGTGIPRGRVANADSFSPANFDSGIVCKPLDLALPVRLGVLNGGSGGSIDS
jgi:hypothetical protein